MIWRKPSHSRIAQLADFLTSILAFGFAYILSGWLNKTYPYIFPPQIQLNSSFITIIILFGIITVAMFSINKAYSYQRFTSVSTEFFIILKVTFIIFLVSISLIFLLGMKDFPRTILILFYLLNILLFSLQKAFLFLVAQKIRKRGKDRKKVILVGTGRRAINFINIVNQNFGWGLDIIGILTDDSQKIGSRISGVEVIDHSKNIENILKLFNPQEVIFTISTKRFNSFRDVFDVCEREGVQIRLNSDFFGYITKDVRVDKVYGLNIISFSTVKRNEFDLYLKRIIDIVGSIVALILFAPIILIAALCIWISDGRPIIYNWNVVGIDKKPIRSWKLRTMVINADSLKEKLLEKNEMDGPVFKIKDDPRIIPCGKWIRKYSIDETPQLISVLKGDLSLVGPRPAGPHELDRYESWQRRKLSIKPGLTCLWQIHGRNEIKKFDDWVKLDLFYIDNWTLWLDLKILFKTVFAVINSKGAR